MNYIMPCILGFIVLYGLFKKVDVFETFVCGARDSIKTIYNIAPTLIGLIVSVTMLKESGALTMLSDFVSPVTQKIGYPSELLPLSLLRPVSGGGSTALLTGVLKDFGPDSYIGRCASVVAGSTETTFYAISVYSSAVQKTKIRHTLFASLMADFTAVVVSVMMVNLFF